MGQIYSACIYDIEERTACVMDADKFHANCYSYCGAVAVTHYLLRNKPHNDLLNIRSVPYNGYLINHTSVMPGTNDSTKLNATTNDKIRFMLCFIRISPLFFCFEIFYLLCIHARSGKIKRYYLMHCFSTLSMLYSTCGKNHKGKKAFS